MPKREATKQEAEEAAHVLSHQAWMPTCSEWIVIERHDGSVYVRGHMDPDVPDEIGRAGLDALPHYLSGRGPLLVPWSGVVQGPRSYARRHESP